MQGQNAVALLALACAAALMSTAPLDLMSPSAKDCEDEALGTSCRCNDFSRWLPADGYIIERRNEQGIAWSFHYSNKLLQRVVHSPGREVNFITCTYTPNVFGTGHGRLASATRPATPAVTTDYHYEDTRFPMR